MVKINDRVKTATGKKGIIIRIYDFMIVVKFDDGFTQYYTRDQFMKVFKN